MESVKGTEEEKDAPYLTALRLTVCSYHIAIVFNAPRHTASHWHAMPVTSMAPNPREVDGT